MEQRSSKEAAKKQQVCLPSLPLRTSLGDTGRSFLSALISSRMRSCSVGGACACGFSLRADTCHRRSAIRFMACSAVCQLLPIPPPAAVRLIRQSLELPAETATLSSKARFTPEICCLLQRSSWFTELQKVHLQQGTLEPCERSTNCRCSTVLNNLGVRIGFGYNLSSNNFFKLYNFLHCV